MTGDHPHTDPGDGRQECRTCGKFVWPALHSCKRVPVTPAARQRAGMCDFDGYLYQYGDGDLSWECGQCGFFKNIHDEPFHGNTLADFTALEQLHRSGSWRTS